jgi:lipid II isoglutaminyl synthase (glutamine-hydrolysing)
MFLKVQIYILYIISRMLTFFIKVFKLGNATSLPGLLVEKFNINVLKYFNNKYKKIIFISGTNGKTTTRAVLVDFIEKNGFKVCTNRGGANIARGIASSLLSDLNFLNKVQSDYLVLEVEEATLPKLKDLIKIDYLILTNVFRDQLDAYGEIDKTIEYFNIFLKDQYCEVVINGDDPKLLNVVSSNTKNRFFYCGLQSDESPNYEGNISVKVNYHYFANEITYDKGEMNFKLNNSLFKTQLSGVYNIYNIIFAYVVAEKLNLKNLGKLISEFPPVFGRGEVFDINGEKTYLYLVKNPEGFNQVLQYIKKAFHDNDLNFFFLVNDQIADSRDVSWLWDVEFEKYRIEFLKNNVNITNIYTGGSRADDILLRLEYADFYSLNYGNNLGSIECVVDNINLLNSTNIVFATYTAMLEFRKELSKYMKVESITKVGS